MKRIPIDAFLKLFKTVATVAVDAAWGILAVIVGCIIIGIFIGIPYWIVAGLLNPRISPWELARDQGWLPWTLRVEANVGTQWLPDEERTCASTTYSQESVDVLDCSNGGSTYHNIPVEFTGKRDHAKDVNAPLGRPRRWRCRRVYWPLSPDHFACRED